MVTVMSKTIFLDTYSNKSYENGIPSPLLPVHTNFLHFDNQLWWNFIFYYNKSLDPSGYLSFHWIVAHALMLPLLGQLWKQDEPFYLISYKHHQVRQLCGTWKNDAVVESAYILLKASVSIPDSAVLWFSGD